MFNKQYKISLMLSTVLLGSSLQAFDEVSEKFIFSLGVGAALTSTKFESGYSGWESGRANPEVGLATSFKLGYGVNERMSLYLFRDSSFVHGYSKAPKRETYGNCITGLGMNYHYKDSEFYSIYGLGMGQLSKLSEGESEAQRGLGVTLGLGCELASHLGFETTYMYINVDDDIKFATHSLQATLNYYFY